MLDRYAIKIIKWPLKTLAALPDKLGISANQVTITGFIISLFTLPALAFQRYDLALVFIVINRLLDGLDGAIARRQGITDCGGFLDITLDFIFYSLVPFGFVLADPNNNAIAGAFLIYSFIGTGSSFLAFAIMAGKRNIESPVYKQKSLYYIGGLTEGTETIACFILFCLFPSYFSIIAWIFGALCWVTTATRIWAGYQTLKQQP
ncbi:Inner membrane protein YnjF [Photobacterium damselae subsp. piscicida]|uniref:CDP-alcohol phosphatidyltransferase family protein n=1 Tax=Photobacterium damsela subsp. piscicida TaxID=38294 RepID=A0A1V1VBW2_PHODP|nr:CDP-alcohol phosphatidyltransferase family protein [Photobacterium damselae]MBE8129139.1 CDP-alcohol phosphatidyltransferase family protein [Photobacterium damselae subsp. piscicida]PSV75289.1 CDP-alcohol phosphatidyltransferase family protein [Photobacterium damselae]PSW78086.1 CDP-alcohol phosphatidyltransferase family protein [Photobacterium damselae]QOD53802.1 CDP-alcohol phosphatidyltransferase family protein [Photobacterium damselae subsp. piscicida]QOD57632.1 CDP-alcohol phosphatidyl